MKRVWFSQEKYQNLFNGCVNIATVIPKKTVTAYLIRPQYLPWICYTLMVNSHITFYCFRWCFNRKYWCYGSLVTSFWLDKKELYLYLQRCHNASQCIKQHSKAGNIFFLEKHLNLWVRVIRFLFCSVYREQLFSSLTPDSPITNWLNKIQHN